MVENEIRRREKRMRWKGEEEVEKGKKVKRGRRGGKGRRGGRETKEGARVMERAKSKRLLTP